MNVSDDLGRQIEAFRERTMAYRRLGYDRFGAARLLSDCVGTVEGPSLDIGTGEGIMAADLASRSGTRVVTVDIDESDRGIAVVVAQQSGVLAQVRFVHADAGSLPFGDDEFCCTVSMDVLHHLADPQSAVREMVRVVKPGGVVVLADFNRSGLDLVARVHCTEGREHAECGITVKDAQSFAESLGLKAVRHPTVPFHDVAVLRKPEHHNGWSDTTRICVFAQDAAREARRC